MNNTLRITIEDTAGSMVARARGALANPTRLNRIAAEGALPVVERSLLRMAETNHNRFGVRSSFWSRMNDDTYAGSEGEDAFVSMPRPVALRAFGGTVTPKESKYLAIPAVAEAYGSSPRDHDDLVFVMTETVVVDFNSFWN